MPVRTDASLVRRLALLSALILTPYWRAMLRRLSPRSTLCRSRTSSSLLALAGMVRTAGSHLHTRTARGLCGEPAARRRGGFEIIAHAAHDRFGQMRLMGGIAQLALFHRIADESCFD